MNYSMAIFLISDKARAVMVTYEAGDNAPRTMFKTLDQSIKVGDYVTVQTDTRHHMTVCQVAETDIEPDFDSSATVKWIIGVVERADFDDLVRQENEAIARIKSAEKRRKREELRESLLADANGDLKALPIYSRADEKPAG